jgi:hypothetical protein
VATATKRAAAKKTAPSKPSKKSSAENKQYVRKADMNSRPTGASGLKRSNGIIYEEFLTELIGQRANKIYKEMTDNDPVIGAMLFAVDMFMRRVHWFTEAAGEDDKSKSDAQFLEECRDDMSITWPDFISEINTMLPFGWSWFEILYKMRDESLVDDEGNPKSKFNDGRVGWRRFDIRSQDSFFRWDFDDNGGVRGLWQIPAPDYEEKYIPISNSLLFRTTSRKGNPEGRSILRNAYRPWYFKKRIEEIEGIGIERDLAGLPFAEVPAEMLREDASDEDKEALASIVELITNVRRDEQDGVIWPQSWDDKGNKMYEFKLMNSGGSRQFSTDSVITRYEQRMAMTILTDFILLGNDSTGSFALSTSKAGMFQSVLTSWLDIIADVLNNFAIPRLFRMNNIPGPYPKLRHEEVQAPSLADLATFVAALAGAGAQLFPDVELENHFRKIAQLPLRPINDQEVNTEDDLRQQSAVTALETSRAQAKQAKSGVIPGQPGQGGAPQFGKKPGSRPGAPTPTTGAVKSKLPPQQRRATASVRASNNITKRRPKNRNDKRTIRVARATLERILS